MLRLTSRIGWFTEEALLFARELARALVADFESSSCRIQSFDEHSLSGTHQAKLFLILQQSNSLG